MKATKDIEKLLTTTVLSVEHSEDAIIITSRSLMGVERKIMIVASSDGKLGAMDVSESNT